MLTRYNLFLGAIKENPKSFGEIIKQLFIIADNFNLGFTTIYESDKNAISYIDSIVNRSTIFDTFSYNEKDTFSYIFYDIYQLFKKFDEIHYDSEHQDEILEELYVVIKTNM